MTSALGGGGGSPKSRPKELNPLIYVRNMGGSKIRKICGRHIWKPPKSTSVHPLARSGRSPCYSAHRTQGIGRTQGARGESAESSAAFAKETGRSRNLLSLSCSNVYCMWTTDVDEIMKIVLSTVLLFKIERCRRQKCYGPGGVLCNERDEMPLLHACCDFRIQNFACSCTHCYHAIKIYFTTLLPEKKLEFIQYFKSLQ